MTGRAVEDTRMHPRWMQNKEWASGRITCKAGTAALLTWILAGVSNALIWTITILIWRYERDAVKAMALFCGIGLGRTVEQEVSLQGPPVLF